MLHLAFCYYLNRQFYEADILAEHLARRYPKGGLSPRATAIGMQALADAYNTYTEVDRLADIDRLVQLAKYTAETWADREEGDDARYNLGQIHFGRGQYDQAIAAFAAIRSSAKWFESQTRRCRPLGQEPGPGAHGGQHQGRARGPARHGDPQGHPLGAPGSRRRPDGPRTARQCRRPGHRAHGDGQACGGPPAPRPHRQGAERQVRAGILRLMEAQLTAFIGTNQVQQAIATMKALDRPEAEPACPSSTSSSAGSSRDARHAPTEGKLWGLCQMHLAYKTFLTTLAASKTGQTYESLEWAGESLVTLDANKEAEEVLRRVLKEFTQGSQFLQQPNGRGKLLRTRLKLAAAPRGQREADQAGSIVEELVAQNPRFIEPQFEEGSARSRGGSGEANQGAESQVVGGVGALGKACRGHRADEALAIVLLRRLVPRGLGALEAGGNGQGARRRSRA